MGKERSYENTIKPGDVFNNWTVINHMERQETEKNRPKEEKRILHKVLCRCACGLEKPVTAEMLLSGKSKSCGCMNRVSKEKQKQHAKEYKQKYWKKNKEKIMEKRRSKPQVSKEKRFEYTIKHKYGMTVEDFESWYIVQRGRCWLCEERFDETVHTKKICIDHDHSTGEVRSLLCWKCNVGLSFFNEDPDLLIKASLYLGGGKCES